MKRNPVESSSLAAVGYEPKTRVLEIEFLSGAVYRYFDVEAKVHEELMNASSKGRYFNERIRDVYRYGRIK